LERFAVNMHQGRRLCILDMLRGASHVDMVPCTGPTLEAPRGLSSECILSRCLQNDRYEARKTQRILLLSSKTRKGELLPSNPAPCQAPSSSSSLPARGEGRHSSYVDTVRDE
jgi:hypothetical protein